MSGYQLLVLEEVDYASNTFRQWSVYFRLLGYLLADVDDPRLQAAINAGTAINKMRPITVEAPAAAAVLPDGFISDSPECRTSPT